MLQCGIASKDITPPVGYPLAGFAARKDTSKGIHDSLNAKAVVIESGSTVSIVTADLVSFPNAMVDEIREKASNMTDIPAHSIMLSTSHTHSGPSLDDNYGGQGIAPDHYWKYLVDAVAGAIYEAWIDRSEARIGFSTGAVEGIGVNRRNPTGKPVDPQTAVMVIEQRKTLKKAIFVNYTCHAVVLGPDNLYITADYPGFAMRTLKKLMGGETVVMFSNGAAGDVNTGHSADLSALGYPIPGRSFERAQKLGNILAGEVFSIVQKVVWHDELRVDAAHVVKQMPTKSLPSLEEAEEKMNQNKDLLQAKIAEGLDDDHLIPYKVQAFYSELLLYRVKEQKHEYLENTIQFEIQAVRLGELLLLAIPVELFVTIGLNVKQRSPFPITAIVGYANGHLGYLPCKETYQEGGYEAVSTRFSDEGAELAEAYMVELAEQLFS